MPKVFISHSWEDNEIARKIADRLKNDGVTIWVDYESISGGDSLPDKICEALEWCDVLLLIWSNPAISSYYVGLEWKSALDLQKKIIPCVLDGSRLPAILRSFLYIDFRDFEDGYFKLLRALRGKIYVPKSHPPEMEMPSPPEIPRTEFKPAKIQPAPEIRQTEIPVKEAETTANLPEEKPKIPVSHRETFSQKNKMLFFLRDKKRRQQTLAVILGAILVVGGFTVVPKFFSRISQPGDFTSDSLVVTREIEVKSMLKKHNFFDKYKNENAPGFANEFELQKNGQVVYDRASGLMWQQAGSSYYMNYEKAKEYISQLNRDGFAGFTDWRLPTLEEAMSLMEPKEMNGDLYVDPIFDKSQCWIWTADTEKGGSGRWVVNFGLGYCVNWGRVDYSSFVRAVRLGQSSRGY
jgi:hypothetical protein